MKPYFLENAALARPDDFDFLWRFFRKKFYTLVRQEDSTLCKLMQIGQHYESW